MEVTTLHLFLFALIAAKAYSEEQKAWGPFDFEIGEIGKCDEQGSGDIVIDQLVVKMIAKNTMEVTLDATNKVDFDDNITMTAEVSSYDPEKNAYGSKPMKLPLGSACTALKTYFPKSYKKLFQHIGVEDCPIKANTYNLKKYPFEVSLPLTQAPYKKFRSDLMFHKDGKTLLCVRAFFFTVPEGTVKYPS